MGDHRPESCRWQPLILIELFDRLLWAILMFLTGSTDYTGPQVWFHLDKSETICFNITLFGYQIIKYFLRSADLVILGNSWTGSMHTCRNAQGVLIESDVFILETLEICLYLYCQFYLYNKAWKKFVSQLILFFPEWVILITFVLFYVKNDSC